MTSIKVGDIVHINEKYGEVLADDDYGVGDNVPGTEFTVTRVETPDWDIAAEYGGFYVEGDPQDWGIWAEHIEKVEA